MPDINLLPDDLREKEGREIESAKKKPRVFQIDMSHPAKEKMAVPFKTPPKLSLFGRLFSRKAKSAKPWSAPPKIRSNPGAAGAAAWDR